MIDLIERGYDIPIQATLDGLRTEKVAYETEAAR